MDVASDVFAYALAAGLSGTAFLATVVVLATDRGPSNAAALLLGFWAVLGVAVVAAAVLVDLVTGAGGQQVVVSLIQVGLGLLLLSTAWRVRPGSSEGPDIEAKMAALSVKAQSLRPSMALRVGVGVALLPKRLVITLLAGAAIGAAGVSFAQGLALSILFVLVATAVVWVTIVAYLVGGTRARDGLETGRRWVLANAEALAFIVTLVFGLLFTGQGLTSLVVS